jgi:hypothetical protein
MADNPDHQLQQPNRRQRPRRLLQAFSSPDSYGLVLLPIMVTYTLSASITAAWAVSLVLFVQIATIWGDPAGSTGPPPPPRGHHRLPRWRPGPRSCWPPARCGIGPTSTTPGGR